MTAEATIEDDPRREIIGFPARVFVNLIAPGPKLA
jgi:hypothetical protein